MAPDVRGVSAVEAGAIFRGQVISDIDFSQSKLSGLRFVDCKIVNCIFDDCECDDWRMWGTQFSETSFRNAKLKGVAIGTTEAGAGCRFTRVDFSTADLRSAALGGADFEECLFERSRIENVDFDQSRLRRCRFVGDLKNVVFGGLEVDPKALMDVDFSEAEFSFVEFRGLNLDGVTFPSSSNCLVIDDYPRSLDRLLVAVRTGTDLESRQLAAFLGVMRRWVGPRQSRGVLSKSDITEAVGSGAFDRLVKVLQETT